MGCKESFSEASIITKIAFIVAIVSLFCSWIAFTTTSWLIYGNIHLGLWRSCVSAAVPAACDITDGAADGWYTGTHYPYVTLRVSMVLSCSVSCFLTSFFLSLVTFSVDFGVTQAFAIIGFMCQNVGFLLIIFFIFKENCRGNGEVGLAAAALMIVSAFGWLISVAVFGGSYDGIPGSEFHYSYGLAVVACCLGIFDGILMFLSSGSGSVGSK